jgi:hypothetical protein
LGTVMIVTFGTAFGHVCCVDGVIGCSGCM